MFLIIIVMLCMCHVILCKGCFEVCVVRLIWILARISLVVYLLWDLLFVQLYIFLSFQTFIVALFYVFSANFFRNYTVYFIWADYSVFLNTNRRSSGMGATKDRTCQFYVFSNLPFSRLYLCNNHLTLHHPQNILRCKEENPKTFQVER